MSELELRRLADECEGWRKVHAGDGRVTFYPPAGTTDFKGNPILSVEWDATPCDWDSPMELD